MSGADSIVDRFRAEIIHAAVVLDELESASQAEAWSSGALADWWDLEAQGSLASSLAGAAPVASALVAYLEGAEPEVLEIPWGTDVGRHEVVAATELTSPDSPDELAVVLEYEAPSGARHDVSVTLHRGQLVDAVLSPAGLLEAAEGAELALIRTSVAPEVAIKAVASALRSASVDEMSDNARSNLPVLLRRFGVDLNRLASTDIVVDLAPREPDDDRYAASLMISALRLDRDAEPPGSVVAAFESFVSSAQSHDVEVLTEVAGLERPDTNDFDTYLRLLGAYFAPVSLRPHTAEAQLALSQLEWADWLGAILGAIRAGTGTEIDGDVLVSMVNRCPEITTSIPKRDAAQVAWAFEQTLFSWEATGALDDEGRLTDAGTWLLPQAALAAWSDG